LLERGRTAQGVATVSFALVCLIGVAGAFVGLTVSSLWGDELWTAWTLGVDGSFHNSAARMAADDIPPGYYVALFGFCRLFGFSDFSLRLFSALCGAASIGVFIASLGKRFSLTARLFGAAMAVTSEIWFYQAQNARPYTLAFLLGVVSLGLCLRLLADREPGPSARGGWTFAALCAVMMLGATLHFYFLFESLAALIVLGLYLKRLRIQLSLLGLVLLGEAGGYVVLVIRRFSQLTISGNWIPSTPSWYASQLFHAVLAATGVLGLIALAIAASALVLSWRAAPPDRSQPGAIVDRLSRIDPALVLCAGVPVITFAGAVASSILFTPNFTDRNLLICSPFLWGLYAWLYDQGVLRAAVPARSAAQIALALLMLAASLVVSGRLVPRNEPFREAAAWIKTLPACQGRDILVVTSDEKKWAAPGFMEGIIAAETGHYLQPFAKPQVGYMEDVLAGRLPTGLKPELQSRLAGDACPVLAWWPRRVSLAQVPAVTAALAADIAQPGQEVRIRTKGFAAYGPGLWPKLTEAQAFVFYTEPGPSRTP
jgi:hypothetical protein